MLPDERGERVQVDGTEIGAPRGSSVAVPGDTLLIYGRSRELSALERRRADYAGEIGRRHAVAEQQRVREKEDEAAAVRSPGTTGVRAQMAPMVN